MKSVATSSELTAFTALHEETKGTQYQGILPFKLHGQFWQNKTSILNFLLVLKTFNNFSVWFQLPYPHGSFLQRSLQTLGHGPLFNQERSQKFAASASCAINHLVKFNVPDLRDRTKILRCGDLSHLHVPDCIWVFFYFVWFLFIHHNIQFLFSIMYLW